MNDVLVSIIIPVYNVEYYLEECLDSVLSQTYTNIEIICVEDVSEDNSRQILEKYAQNDVRIKIILNTINMGLSSSRNIGFSLANGKYTYYLDSDDYIKPNAIEELVYYAEKFDVECIYFDSILLEETRGLGTPSLSYGLDKIDKKIYDGPNLFRIMKENDVYTNSVWRRFWKTNFLKDNNLYFADGLLAEDTLFSLKAILCGKRMMIVNKSYHIYRRREGTLSTQEIPLKAISLFKNYCMLLDFWREHQVDEAVARVLSRHLESILITAKRVYARTKSEISVRDFEEGIERHLFEVLLVQNYEKSLNDIDEKILQEIRAYENIVVYGAGRYAVETVEKLNRKGVEISNLIVTRLHSNVVGIGDIPVKEIKEICHEKDKTMVILGVGKKNREDIVMTLDKYGFKHYICLD